MAESTPEPVLIPTLPVEPKSKLTLGDSIGVFALLIGVFLVIVIPPLLFKIVLLVGVGTGVFLFSRYSHWTHGWAKSKQFLVASILTVLLCAIAIPQFVSQWRDEHSKKAEAPQQSPSSQPSPKKVVPMEPPQTELPTPSASVVKRPSVKKNNPIPTSSQQQSGTNNIQTGPIAIAPNGIANAAPNFGNQTVNNVPPVRRLPEDRTAFISCLKLKPGKFSISALANNQEAYNYAQDWHDVFLAAGWEIEHKDTPIQIFMIGGGMWSGMRINMHATAPNGIEIADNSPEKEFYGCLTTVPLGAAGAIIPYNDIPTGVVRILISSRP